MKALPLVVLVLALAVSRAAAPGESSWRMKADYEEACSCHLFCQCYFNKQAEHPICEFNMAVTVREGHFGNVDLANTKYWLTGDIGDKWGTEKEGAWVTVSFDPKTTQSQRDAFAPIILRTYGLELADLTVQEAPIAIRQSAETPDRQLPGRTQGHLR